jgi:hypothetical protein
MLADCDQFTDSDALFPARDHPWVSPAYYVHCAYTVHPAAAALSPGDVRIHELILLIKLTGKPYEYA